MNPRAPQGRASRAWVLALCLSGVALVSLSTPARAGCLDAAAHSSLHLEGLIKAGALVETATPLPLDPTPRCSGFACSRPSAPPTTLSSPSPPRLDGWHGHRPDLVADVPSRVASTFEARIRPISRAYGFDRPPRIGTRLPS